MNKKARKTSLEDWWAKIISAVLRQAREERSLKKRRSVEHAIDQLKTEQWNPLRSKQLRSLPG